MNQRSGPAGFLAAHPRQIVLLVAVVFHTSGLLRRGRAMIEQRADNQPPLDQRHRRRIRYKQLEKMIARFMRRQTPRPQPPEKTGRAHQESKVGLALLQQFRGP